MYNRQVSSFREKLNTRILRPKGEKGTHYPNSVTQCVCLYRFTIGAAQCNKCHLCFHTCICGYCFFCVCTLSMKERGLHRPLTRSLVFDEEKFQALLEGVFIHIKLYLHPNREEKKYCHTRIRRTNRKSRTDVSQSSLQSIKFYTE